MVIMNVFPICLLHAKVNSEADVLHVLQSRLSCEFPSPADHDTEALPSLDELLIKHPSATFLGQGQRDFMIERGIINGSLLIIDRAIAPERNSTIVASIGGELLCSNIRFEGLRYFLSKGYFYI
jgi:DNA polymerase V